MISLKSEVLIDGLIFPECPRWRDGKLFFSDMHAHKVMTVDLQGTTEVLAEFPHRAAGLGFLPDGRLLVCTMRDLLVHRLEPGGVQQVADLTQYGDDFINDMVVDGQGRAFIGARNKRLSPEHPPSGRIVLLTLDGATRMVADEIDGPNGSVITPDGKTLIVAETAAHKLTAFDIEDNGALSNRRIFAELEERVADGICLDAEGAVWIGSPGTRECARVLEGGEVTHAVNCGERWPLACMLGGDDGRTLFLMNCITTSENMASLKTPDLDKNSVSKGWIETLRVDVPHAGFP
jgi:sugar lactone lactonase YvrE